MEAIQWLESLVREIEPYGAVITLVECGWDVFSAFHHFMPACLVGVPLVWCPQMDPGYTLVTVRD